MTCLHSYRALENHGTSVEEDKGRGECRVTLDCESLASPICWR